MSQENDNVVRLRGLPWTTGSEDVIQFLEGCSINDVHFIYTKEGKPSGEAYVELNSEDDFNLALTKNQQYLGKRYIDVFAATSEEMDWAVKKSGVNPLDSNEDAVVRLRGLPFSCDRENLLKFFDGLPVTPNGVSLMTDPMGNATGEAFVQFANQSVADVALKKHMERIGHRYIEIFKSSLQEARTAIADAHRAAQEAQNCYQRDFQPASYHPRRPTPYERPNQRYDPYGRRDRMRSYAAHNDYYEDAGYPPRKRPQYGQRGRPQRSQNSNFVSQTGFSVFMRGLPFSATEADIMDFFSPVVPSSVAIERDHDGRNRGEAHVDFVCKADANQAMTRDRAPMKHRYIELFYTGREGHHDSDGYNNNWNAF